MNRKPNHRQHKSRNDGNIRAVKPPARARDHGKGHVVNCADGAVGSDDDGYDEESDGDDDQSVFVVEAYGEDAAGELPGADVESVGDPVCFALILVFESIMGVMEAHR